MSHLNKKIVNTLLIFFLCLPLGVALFPTPSAADDVLINDGMLYFSTRTQKAATDIRFKTVGFFITRSTVCVNSSGTSESDNTKKYQCNPKRVQYAKLDNLQQVAEDDNGTYLTTYFEVSKKQVSIALRAAGMSDLRQNDTIYLHSIFNVETGPRANPTYVSGPHNTLLEIKSAQPWANPNEFGQYYDIRAVWNAHYQAKAFSIIKGGSIKNTSSILDEEQIKSNHANIGYEWLPGESVSYTFKDKLQKNGKNYKIVKSYIINESDDSLTPNWTQSVGDPSLLTRNPSVNIDGVYIVAEYEEGSNPVKARFIREDDKSELNPDEDLGVKATGEEVKYSYKQKEFIEKNVNGFVQRFQLVRTYITANKKPDEKKFVQEKTDPKLFDRSLTVDDGGSTIVGEYKLVQNPVEAIYETEDGKRIKTVDKGEKVVGQGVQHTFEGKVTFEGKEYEIIRSYIIQNQRPDDKQFIQVKGDTNLLNRNITVGKGGSKFVGIYKSTTDPCTGNNCGGGGSCSATIGTPSRGSSLTGSVMDPSATGVLKADNRGNELFDVAKGIPTSENLYANVFGNNYLFKNTFVNMTGQVTLTVNVKKTYHLTWTIPSKPPAKPGDTGTPAKPMSKDVTVSKDVQVKRDYSYWTIDNLEVYSLNKASVSNYALGGYGGTITLNPNGYTAPTLDSENNDSVNSHVIPPDCSAIDLGTETRSGGSSEPSTPDETSLFQSKADGQIKQNKVKNDKVIFNGITIMDPREVDKSAPAPQNIPHPQTIGQNVLYKNALNVSNSLTNKLDQATSGQIYYNVIPGNIKGGANKNYAVQGMNTVTVHTPVVIYASVSDDKKHNQKTTPAPNRSATILDRPFTIYMPTEGQHRNILGYKNRDYAKYIKDKQVWFPFDVYSENKQQFYPKNTWISIPVNEKSTTFFLPVWVDEGYYDVLFRTIAENAPNNFTTQANANLDLAHHVATDVVPVDVIGRVYDFHVTDIADYNWESFFRKSKGSSLPTGNSFWVGDKGIDGNQRQSLKDFILPIRQGSNPIPGLQNMAVKTGYHFKFDLKSKGNMFTDKDGIRITPNFYFVSKDGTGRKPVDLYYHSDKQKFIKVGSQADTERRNVILNARLRNVPSQDIVNTASTLWEMFAGPRGWKIDKQRYLSDYIKDTAKKTYVGGYDVQVLTAPLRLFIGNMNGLPKGVNIYRANAAVQQWFGEYSLPAAVYVVPQGTNLSKYGKLDEKSKVFLKDGYIIVNFTIETIRDGDTSKPYLQYIRRPGSPYFGAYNNQWKDMENFASSFTTPYGVKFNSIDGDVMYYHANKSSYDDFTSSGTH